MRTARLDPTEIGMATSYGVLDFVGHYQNPSDQKSEYDPCLYHGSTAGLEAVGLVGKED